MKDCAGDRVWCLCVCVVFVCECVVFVPVGGGYVSGWCASSLINRAWRFFVTGLR